MSHYLGVVFAQLTDIHVGEGLNPQEAVRNLQWALQEINGFTPKPSLVLVTADLVCAGRANELEIYAKTVANSSVPLYALPANHDLWGEKDTAAWERLVGPLRQSVVIDGLHFILWDDIQRRQDGKGWKAMLSPVQCQWLKHSLREANGRPVIVAQHCPPLHVDGYYHDAWQDSNADELLELLSPHKVLAIVTGHWHRNGEWVARGVRIINTGALCGWQWNAIPPHWCFPTRPGYRLFHWDGESLRTFWRDGSYWQTPAPQVQVTIVRIGDAHTGGPRPQVHPILVSAPATIHVAVFTTGKEISGVEWSLCENNWRPMQRVYSGIWSEWVASVDPAEFRGVGMRVLYVRAITNRPAAYDAVPVKIATRECSFLGVAAIAGREMVYELFYPPR